MKSPPDKITLNALFASFWYQRKLILKLTRREVQARYRGSIFGLFWSLFQPVLMLMIYTFIFSFVFEVRWGKELESRYDFALLLFIGLIVHAFFAECLNRSPRQIHGNIIFVKRIMFPIEIFSWVTICVALFQAAINYLVLQVFFSLVHGTIHWTVLLIPIVFAPLIILTSGICWFLAASGVYFRDINETIQILTLALLFLAPVFYPVSALPPPFRPFIFINPITFIIEQARAVIIWGAMPNWPGLIIYYALALLTAWFGFATFRKFRGRFADVL
ncbi:ABC transporter permease [candidate division CSSED10-310 bacterium]|uniref:Transport permease protein n=1 Tax=candidate division CSSED10-310 bacterium TaxID=2855610 RepID=A0ABV6YVN2_UNCC1